MYGEWGRGAGCERKLLSWGLQGALSVPGRINDEWVHSSLHSIAIGMLINMSIKVWRAYSRDTFGMRISAVPRDKAMSAACKKIITKAALQAT